MPRSLYKQGVKHPLNPENSEFSHSLGRIRTLNLGKSLLPVWSKKSLNSTLSTNKCKYFNRDEFIEETTMISNHIISKEDSSLASAIRK